MTLFNNNKVFALTIIGLFLFASTFAHPIDDYYKTYKNDSGMEAKTVPPKLASLFIDEEYPEAIDVLQAMSTLKYLNFYGDQSVIEKYAMDAIGAKGDYKELLHEVDGSRTVNVYGIKKKGKVRKIIAVVRTKSQFLLLIGKGKLTKKHIASLPALSKEIQ
ncbi:MAG: hypothetical protein ACI857_002923 [Arenicella sp.]|jgi:hypothetical protein